MGIGRLTPALLPFPFPFPLPPFPLRLPEFPVPASGLVIDPTLLLVIAPSKPPRPSCGVGAAKTDADKAQSAKVTKLVGRMLVIIGCGEKVIVE